MKLKGVNSGTFLCVFLFIILLLTACTSTNTAKTSKTAPENKKTTVDKTNKVKPITIVQVVPSQDGSTIVLDVEMKNNNSSSENLKPELFALVSNSMVLSPAAKSDIPQQIPAKTNVEFQMTFELKNLNGTIPLQLAYQPINHSQPQQFFTIGDFTIKKVVSIEQSKTNEKSTDAKPQVVTPAPKPELPKIQLQTQTIGTVIVKVPVGWIKTPYNGGDYGGFQFINPKNANEQMLVVYSACAGCGYSNSNPDTDPPDPVSLIPQEHAIDSFVLKDGFGAGYSFYINGNPNIGNGVVKMKKYEGYAFVEIVLPESDKNIATQVLNSFQFLGVN